MKKLSAAHRNAISAGIRRVLAEGWRPNTDHWAIGLKSITPEDRRRAARKAGETMAGRPQRIDTVCGKHSNHHKAKRWKFENKGLGKTLKGKNLNQLVRDNEALFDPSDLKWETSNSCNAARCLRGLKNKKAANSWKGWMICRSAPT